MAPKKNRTRRLMATAMGTASLSFALGLSPASATAVAAPAVDLPQPSVAVEQEAAIDRIADRLARLLAADIVQYPIAPQNVASSTSPSAPSTSSTAAESTPRQKGKK